MRKIATTFAILMLAATCLADDGFNWLKRETERHLSGCKVVSKSGVVLYTPDGIGHYKALWTRDVYYMVKYAPGFISTVEVKASIEYLLNGQREDGCIPDRVNAEGKAIYSPGGENSPLADHALDNGPFLALLACEYVKRTGDLDFFKAIEPKLKQGLDQVHRAGNGLVYNPQDAPQCVYGFTDIVTKTGHLLFSSLLYYQACIEMEQACLLGNLDSAAVYAKRAKQIRKNISLLWDKSSGMFFAANKDCRQIDIWGSAYAVSINIATQQQEKRVTDYLLANKDTLFQAGQVKHLPAGEVWERLFIDHHPYGSYQNGAYWATPLPWVVETLARRDPTFAWQLVNEAIEDFQKNGSAECIFGDYRKVPDFVVSMTNLYGAYSYLSQSKN